MKAVPDNFSAYNPKGGRWGELCPIGKAPGIASVLARLEMLLAWVMTYLLVIGAESSLIHILLKY